ncbi:TonB-dependent receptor [Niveispirillum sp.]|uniref:TonB-dependent receptor n=1 Tax=Niveispirillum sp. TaxID=1917217 RepID=UPI001B76C9ED|nr:TonB-dependent receptor [Niveispirillum sp.]MBP7338619.1 TonB-dependent receptor [Niveispirillum sp.]
MIVRHAQFASISAVTLLGLLAALPAKAQQAAVAANEVTLEEIVVTARKRSEVSQKVPATITQLDMETITAKAVNSFTEISKVMPSVNISKAPSPGAYSITIRGLGSEPGNPSFDSSVSMFVDGVFTARAREFANSMFDAASLEMIKGTQAALLGKNTSLGAVNLTTRKPGDDFAANALYTHDFEQGSDRVEGGVDLPLGEAFKVRVAGFYDDYAGALYNTITAKRTQRQKSQGGRVVAVWNPSDDVDVTAAMQTFSSDSYGTNAEFVAATAVPGALAALAGYPGVFEGNLDGRTAVYSSVIGDDRGEQGATRGSLTINWALGGYTLTAQSGFTRSDVNTAGNTSYLPGNYGWQKVNDDSKQFTQEVRVTSPQDLRVEFIAGALYLNGSYDNDTVTNSNSPARAPSPAILGTTATAFYQDNEAWSAFGQADAKFQEDLKLSLGLRYTHETKSVDLGRRVITPGIYSTVILPPFAPFSMERSEGNVDASLGLSYQMTPDMLLYGSVGQGTKAGGFAQSASRLDRSEYNSERARTAEGGFKSQFADRSVTLNAAAFYTKIRDFQLVGFNGTSFEVGNTDLRTYGVESELAWAPSRELRFYWNNTYARAKDLVLDDKTTHAPRWSGVVGASYSPRIADDLMLSAYGDIVYRSSEIGQRNQGNVIPIASTTKLNAGIGVESMANGWSLRLLGKNLTNERTFGFVFPAPLQPVGNVIAIPEETRTISLQVGIKY